MESLRLYPVNPNAMERVVPTTGLQTQGFYLPPETVVRVPHYLLQRDPTVYGKDAEKFRPERWLEADADTKDRMEQGFMTVSSFT